MIDESLKKFTQKNDTRSAWREFVSPTDIIGLKVNTLAYPTTHTALTSAVADSLQQ